VKEPREVVFPDEVICPDKFALVVTVAEFPVQLAELPSILVIPVSANEAEALLRATAVVPM
jgi:hypothetical protein